MILVFKILSKVFLHVIITLYQPNTLLSVDYKNPKAQLSPTDTLCALQPMKSNLQQQTTVS